MTARTCPILPTKYALFGMGVPTRLFSVPSERSVAMLIAMFCMLAPRMPDAMIPAMKYWVKVTPPPMS